MDFATLPDPELPRVLLVAGPTGVGKSTFAMRAAELLDGEIVGADSVQIYKRVDIGTAKPSAEQREQVPHHLVDTLPLDADFDVGSYVERAKDVIADIRARGKFPIIVGGTGLYFRLLIHGIFQAPPVDDAIRERFERIAHKEGTDALYERLRDVDPSLAERLDPEDDVRVRRGLEVHEQTGRPLSELQSEHAFDDPNYYPLKLGLIRPRHEIHERINHRFDEMMEAGLLDEYRQLVVDEGFDRDLKPLQAIGYRQMGEHLLDDVPLEEAIRDAKASSRQYAKQQIGWLRGEPMVHWTLAPVADAPDQPDASYDPGALPDRVRRDLTTFADGADPDLDWADIDSYDVERP
jgi:tRNA dimethylallyltransferase